MVALLRFLEVLGTLVLMKNAGQQNDVTRLLNYARLSVRAGDQGKRHLAAAVLKVEQLVAEDRGLNDVERADLDAAITGKLARAAAVVIPPDEPEAPISDGTEGADQDVGGGPTVDAADPQA